MRTAIRCALTLLVLCVAWTLAPVTRAQTAVPVGTSGHELTVAPLPSDTTFRTSTELVALNVTVVDSKEKFVTGLSSKDFAVFEDGVPQQITFFATTNVPLDVAVMIDESSSMGDKMASVQEAANRFLDTLRPVDRGEVIGFATESQVIVPWTSDKAVLQAAIKKTKARGSTALYTSLYVAVHDLSKLAKREDGVRRPAIVILTDGDDTASSLAFEDLLDVAKRSNVAVYTISIVSPYDSKRFDEGDPGKRFMTDADFALKSLAQETGGRSFFPLRLSDLNGVYEQIAQELTSQYSIGYSPKIRGDGSFHRLMVRVVSHEDARTRTRTGYYAPTSRASLDTR